ncbi:Cystathionine gamma-synthase [Diatrype stigma]|uniref:cystathionine gamma-synthase n=1 Tax=Diatrype stigma TaxID=117547 RepID=A0AAN9URM8_9PEZI
MPSIDLGESIPPNTPHAISVSLPTWKSNIGYEEGEGWVMNSLTSAYPRFGIHKSIQAFARDIVAKYGQAGQTAMLFPTKRIALRCVEFMKERVPEEAAAGLDTVTLILDPSKKVPETLRSIKPAVSAVLCSQDAFPFAKQYWQHSGDGVSSRRAEFSHGLFNEGLLVLETPATSSPRSPQSKIFRGPRRYQRPGSIDGFALGGSGNGNGNGNGAGKENGKGNGKGNGTAGKGDNVEDKAEAIESSRFLEERYGRNLDLSLVDNAKSAIRRRIAGVLTTDVDLTASLPTMSPNARGLTNLKEDDIYLMPCGMNAIFTTHQLLLKARGPGKSIEFGFPYVDTLKILQKFGPGAVFYGRGSDAELDDLEARLRDGGERFLGFFCEFPGNPLLTCPDLARVRRLADEYGFAVVVDETVGTFVNVNVLPYADVVVSSLTKIFSGDANVMGGSFVLNPNGPHYAALKKAATEEGGFEDTYWAEDAIFMERNSRDFRSRIDGINANAEAIAAVLRAHPLVKQVYYPLYNESRPHYEACRVPGVRGGYGGLLSVTLRTKAQAVAFYDALDTAKGPSLGTNFTLTSPYVLLAHYQELDWAASFGVEPDLLRISVGLEDNLEDVFRKALQAAESVAAEGN